jgi:type IV pilus assembly protein PilB
MSDSTSAITDNHGALRPELAAEAFAACKPFIADRFRLAADTRAMLAKANPAQLYAAGDAIGVPPVQMAQAIAAFLQLPYVGTLNAADLRAGVLSDSFRRARRVLPIVRNGEPAFALANPFDVELLDTLRQQHGARHRVTLVVVHPELVDRFCRDGASSARTGESVAPSASDRDPFAFMGDSAPEAEAEAEVEEYAIASQAEAEKLGHLPPIVRLVNMVLSNAVKASASDVHIEPQEAMIQVRFRIDGVLVPALRIPKHMHAPLVSRLKILAHLDIAENRKPQDGRIRLRFEDRRIDLRLSILPTPLGQKAVVRLLDSEAGAVGLDELAFSPEVRAGFERALSASAGMILVSGPTGSGKSTTLYAAINHLASPMRNIVTVENPIEIQMAGITQTQVDVKAGVTFATVLRSMLRQDPDVILVGEMRDRETAGIAMEASQTGHLLLSTVHTNDAPSTITRLLDFDIDPFKITSSLVGVLAQRLVRRVCQECAIEDHPDPRMLQELATEVAQTVALSGRPPQWRKGLGCPACHQSGYKGRLAIHELLEITDGIRGLIYERAPDHVIREQARRNGMRTLLEDGVIKAAAGVTTLEEVIRVAPRSGSRDAAKDAAKDVASAPPAVAAPTAPVEAVSVPLASVPVVAVDAAPVAPEVPDAPVAATAPVAPAPPSAPRILVLDDDVDMQELLKLWLESDGHQVTVAGDGVEALLELGRQSYDLILSDIYMPNLDGLQLLELKTRKGVTVPIVVLSADGGGDTEQRALELGAMDFIAKPTKKNILLMRVQRILRQAAA